MSILNISLREARVTVGRTLWLTGIPLGAAPSARETVIACEAVGLAGFRRLRDDFDLLTESVGRRLALRSDGADVVVDGTGVHAFFAVPGLLDVAALTVARHAHARVRVDGVTRPDLLAVLPHLAQDGLRVDVQFLSPESVEIVAERGAADASPVDAVATQGMPVDADLYWELYRLSDRALTPDSPLSRNHTGRSVFNENGEVIGELGEDWHGEVPASAK
ncbi:hypothetical protein HC028_14795 [Planosporangium flavigriseum]|uniref:Uncharacterized protein n=1 Tax=Planosporangium flavigriseum TaxID=373681 RepID=A0A8J3LKQ9_9ACTN|nr:hypothetical protein [Planosporangium flavigriseum]NJC65758.1 hypothetical protein [Planosporangium flavigriseum]GIG73612.1 hypothetical protein Pfl04_20160 [Planosporangium flavigriseum]